jgi:hypothetical protein
MPNPPRPPLFLLLFFCIASLFPLCCMCFGELLPPSPCWISCFFQKGFFVI